MMVSCLIPLELFLKDVLKKDVAFLEEASAVPTVPSSSSFLDKQVISRSYWRVEIVSIVVCVHLLSRAAHQVKEATIVLLDKF